MFEGTERMDEIECFRVVLGEVDDFDIDSIWMLVSYFESKSFILVEVRLVRVSKLLEYDIDTDVA